MGRFAAFNEASLDMPSDGLWRSRQLARIDFVPTRCSRLESASMGTVAWPPHTPNGTHFHGAAHASKAPARAWWHGLPYTPTGTQFPWLRVPRKRQHGHGGMVFPTPRPAHTSTGQLTHRKRQLGHGGMASPHPERDTLPRGCACIESGRRRMVTRQDASQRHERSRYSSLRMLEHPFVPLAGNTQSPTRGCLDPP